MKPNFFIIGTPKAGTTSLHNYLGQHPDIFMSNPKEPFHFTTDFHEQCITQGSLRKDQFLEYQSLEKYESLFSKANEKVRGEASPGYLLSKDSAKNIYDYNPEAKLLACFREPSSYLYSAYLQLKRSFKEDAETFEEAIELENSRRLGINIPEWCPFKEMLYYTDKINYAVQLERYLKLFPSSQVKVILFEDFIANPSEICKDIFKFLEVDSFDPIINVYNKASKQRVRFLFNPSLYNLYKYVPRSVKEFGKYFLLKPIDSSQKQISEDIVDMCSKYVYSFQELLDGYNYNIDIKTKWKYY